MIQSVNNHFDSLKTLNSWAADRLSSRKSWFYLFGNIQETKFVEEYRLNDENYFQLQIKILCHHVPGDPAYMLSKYQSVVQFRDMKVFSGQYCFDWVQDQASFQMKFFMPSLTFNILSRKCSDVAIQYNVKEWRKSLVWLSRKSMFCHERFLDHSLREI